MEPLSFTMTCELRSLLSSGGPYDLKVYEKGKTILMTTEWLHLITYLRSQMKVKIIISIAT